jgi:hypothetical protein
VTIRRSDFGGLPEEMALLGLIDETDLLIDLDNEEIEELRLLV